MVADLRPGARAQDRDDHQGHAGADGHRSPMRRHDLRAAHPSVAGAGARGGLRQSHGRVRAGRETWPQPPAKRCTL